MKPFTREQKRLVRRGIKGALAAADELMAEFISKTRAANWGVLNSGLYEAERLASQLKEKRA